MPLTPRHRELIRIFDDLPLGATVPVQVAAAVRGVSERTIRRTFNLVLLSPGRVGVRKSDLVEEKVA